MRVSPSEVVEGVRPANFRKLTEPKPLFAVDESLDDADEDGDCRLVDLSKWLKGQLPLRLSGDASSPVV